MSFWLILFAFFTFLGKTTGKLQAEADRLVKATAGDDALLKCTFTVDEVDVDLSRLSVLWFHAGKQLVEFDKEVTVFKKDVSLSQEELENGNASLLISRVGPQNAGSYRCYITYLPEISIQEVTLQVIGSQPEDDTDDLPLSTQCFGHLEILMKLDQIAKTLEEMDAKLHGFSSGSNASPMCDSELASREPSH